MIFDEDGSAPIDNLYARLGTAAPNFCFAGHTDVVPVGDLTAWSVDPFAAEIQGTKLIGRGAVDMSGIAAFEYYDNPQTLVLYPLLQFDQLDLKPDELLFVDGIGNFGRRITCLGTLFNRSLLFLGHKSSPLPGVATQSNCDTSSNLVKNVLFVKFSLLF